MYMSLFRSGRCKGEQKWKKFLKLFCKSYLKYSTENVEKKTSHLQLSMKSKKSLHETDETKTRK